MHAGYKCYSSLVSERNNSQIWAILSPELPWEIVFMFFSSGNLLGIIRLFGFLPFLFPFLYFPNGFILEKLIILFIHSSPKNLLLVYSFISGKFSPFISEYFLVYLVFLVLKNSNYLMNFLFSSYHHNFFNHVLYYRFLFILFHIISLSQ